MKELICIICPRGCHLTVDEEHDCQVSGNHCPRGIPYAKAEVLAPKRMVTTTVCTDSSTYPRCPVKTSEPIPKELVFQAMDKINRVVMRLPIKCGDIVVSNICQTGINVVATRDLN